MQHNLFFSYRVILVKIIWKKFFRIRFEKIHKPAKNYSVKISYLFDFKTEEASFIATKKKNPNEPNLWRTTYQEKPLTTGEQTRMVTSKQQGKTFSICKLILPSPPLIKLKALIEKLPLYFQSTRYNGFQLIYPSFLLKQNSKKHICSAISFNKPEKRKKYFEQRGNSFKNRK